MDAKVYDKECMTRAQGRLAAKHDFQECWVEPSEWTEAQMRHHLSVVIDASPEYVDGYIAKLRQYGLK